MNKLRFALLAALAGAAVLTAKPRLVVFDFQSLGIEPNSAAAVTVLLRDRLDDAGFTVVPAPAGLTVATTEDAVAAARAIPADEALLGNVTRLGNKVIVSYKLVKVEAGTVALSDRATVNSVEGLDDAAELIAAAVKAGKPIAVTEEVEHRRPAGMSSLSLSAGYTMPFVHRFPYDPGDLLFTIDGSANYETPTLLAQALIGFRQGENGFQEVGFDLLFHRVFSQVAPAPFIGGGIGVHRYTFGPDWWQVYEDRGLALIASTGATLLRTDYFRAVGGLKVTAAFTGDSGTPVLSGSLGLGVASPTIGAGSGLGADLPQSCVYGCLGAFVITGLVMALTD